MVTTGYSLPYVAKYANVDTTVTYSEGMALARGVSLSIEVEAADDNMFYADNVVAETESGRFTSGSATVTVDGLANDAATLIFGLPDPESVQVNETPVEMQGYGEAMNPPYVGFGCVRQTMHKGKTQYWPIILPKIKFAVPSEEMTTRGESIEWQTQELSAVVERDDTAAKNWKRVSATGFDTEAEAFAVVTTILGPKA